MVAIRVEEEDYLTGLEDCKTHLHGRIILCKGNKPLTHLALTKRLHLVWDSIGPWKAIPLRKGFYEFEFSSLEDMQWVVEMGSWQLSPSFLVLFAWTKEFVTSTTKSTKTQAWVRIYNLPLEYWRPRVVFSITRGIVC